MSTAKSVKRLSGLLAVSTAKRGKRCKRCKAQKNKKAVSRKTCMWFQTQELVLNFKLLHVIVTLIGGGSCKMARIYSEPITGVGEEKSRLRNSCFYRLRNVIITRYFRHIYSYQTENVVQIIYMYK